MKLLKVLALLFVGFSLLLSGCSEPDTGPPAEIVAAFNAIKDSALGPVSTQLKTETGTAGAGTGDVGA